MPGAVPVGSGTSGGEYASRGCEVTRPQFTSRRAQIGVGVVLLAVLGGVGLRFALADDEPVYRGGHGFTTLPLDKGGGYTVGLAIEDAGDKDVEILEVKTRTSPNVELVGVFPGGPGPGGGVEGIAGKIEPGPLKLPPGPSDEGEDRMYAAGFRVTDGLGAFNGITVKYRLGGDTRRDYWGIEGIFCTKPAKDCDPDDDRNFAEKTMKRFGLEDED